MSVGEGVTREPPAPRPNMPLNMPLFIIIGNIIMPIGLNPPPLPIEANAGHWGIILFQSPQLPCCELAPT